MYKNFSECQKKNSVHNIFSPCSELGIFMYWTCNSMNNLSSYCGLADAKIRASDKDLPVPLNLTGQNFQNHSDYLMRFLPLCKLGAQIHLRQLHSLSRLLSFDRHFNKTQWPKFRVLSKNLELFLLNFEWIKQEKITQ